MLSWSKYLSSWPKNTFNSRNNFQTGNSVRLLKAMNAFNHNNFTKARIVNIQAIFVKLYFPNSCHSCCAGLVNLRLFQKMF